MIDVETHFVAVCPHCSAGLKIRRIYLGQQVKCKQCDEVFAAEDGADGGGDAPGGLRPWNAASTSTERIVVTCPSCRAALSVRRAYLGKDVRCKQCDDVFVAADPAGAHSAGSSSHHSPAGNRREVHGEQLERLRGELERITVEYLGLRSAHDQLQAAHDRLTAENGRLVGDRDRIHDDLREQGRVVRGLRDELVALRAEASEVRAERDRLGVERDSIVEALGGIAPGDVRQLADDRSSWTAQVDRLRLEVEALEGERADREREAAERERRSEADRLAARAEASRLAVLIGDRDADLEAARAEAERLRGEKQRAADDAALLRCTLAQIDRELRDLREQDRDEIERLRAEIEPLRAEFERSRPEPAPDPAPPPFPDREEELQEAYARIESLQAALADLHRLEREMRSILGGIGIRFREI